MSEAEAWLRAHVAGAPEPLLARMVRALPDGAASVPEALVRAAVRLYGEVTRGSGTRTDALPLLAADALFTHAFAAQAELDPSELGAMVERWSAGGRLPEVLP